MTTSLSLLGVAGMARAEVGELLPDDWERDVATIPAAGHRRWGCVVVETRLAHQGTRADVMAAVARRPRNATDRRTGWRRTPLGRAWHRGGALADVPLLWFEWDLPLRASEPLAWACLSDGILALKQTPAEVQRARLAAAVRITHDDPWIDAAERALGSLGNDGELSFVASLAPRGRSGLRFAAHVRADRVCRWLDRLGWPGDFAPLARTLFLVASPVERVGIQFELGPEPLPYLGIETRQFSTQAPREQREIIAAVAELARIRPAARAALQRWPGEVSGPGGLATRHAYVKLAHDGAWQAKGYFGVTPGRLSA